MDPLSQLLGRSPALEAVKARARLLLARMKESSRVPLVLIQGETGTGKGLLARALHDASPRSSGPFVAVNCAAIPETLAESELFGFEAGAHSEARRAKPGLFQAATGGTIFLDEVGLLTGAIQTKLLKVIEDRRVRRVGSTREELVNVWIISATNADLQADVREQRFRADLYQRLAVVRLVLPPLRERSSDTMHVAEEFIARSCSDYGLPRKRLAPDAQMRLTHYPWPGNVRELSNVIERAVLLTDGEIIEAATLELDAVRPREPAGPAPLPPLPIREYHLFVLQQTGWNISHAATRLGISRNTLRARIERFGLRAQREGHPAPSMPARDADPGPEVSPSPAAESPLGPAEDGDVVAAAERERAPQAARPLRWDRRRVTLLRINLAMRAAVDPATFAQGLLDEVVRKAKVFGGHLEGLSTAWATFSFGATPVEDSSSRAAHAALAIQRAASRWNDRDEGRLGVVAAIETSHLLVAQDGQSVEIDRDGLHEIDLALIELASRCEAGWIGVGPQIGPFLERRFQLALIEDPASSPAPAHRLIAPKTVGRDQVSTTLPYVGRESEIALLRNRLESVRQGHGQIVAVVGEPGVGKSRLVGEFCRSLGDSDVRILHTAALLPDGPSLFPAIELLRRHLHVAERDGDDEVRVKIKQAIPPESRSERWLSVALGELLGVTTRDVAWAALAPSERREQTLQALSRVLLAESRHAPLVLVFEDLHWVDSETQALIDKLVEAAPAVRMLVLVAYRSEYRHQWASRLHYSELWLEPLSPKEATTLLDALMGTHPTVTDIKDRLVDWTEGNPFFLEEAVRYLATTGALVGEPGRYRLIRPDESLQVPPTVEDVLAERIDRLPPGVRDILECAAVVGREAPLSVLSAIVDQPREALSTGLKILHEIGLLNKTDTAPDPKYRFKHQLTHEVTFRRLASERRRSLYEAVLQHLEAVYPTPQGEALDHLAFYAFRAELWERALTYCQRAGARAYGRSSNSEAAEYFRQARTCLEHLPKTEERLAQAIDILFGLRWALWSQGRLVEMGAVLREAEQRAARLGDRRHQGMVAAYLADYLWATGDNDAAVASGTRALSIAEGVRDDIVAGQARFGLGLARAALGQYREAVAIVGPAGEPMSGGPPDHQRRVIVMAKAYLARYLAELGDFARGISCAESGLEAAEAAGDSFAVLGSLLGLGTLHLRRGDMPAAIAALARGLEIARTRGHVNWVPSLSSSLGLGYALSDRPGEGLDLLAQALAAAESSGISASLALWTAYAAEGHVATGRIASAHGLAERALQLARLGAERGHETWALRALANALARVSGEELDRAIALMQDAATRADALGMRPLVARCQSDLSRMLARRGRQADAKVATAIAERILSELGMARDLGPTPLEVN